MTPMDFSRRWIQYFGSFEQHRLEELGLTVKAARGNDDRVVADRLFEAFEMLLVRLRAFRSDAEREDILVAFEKAIGIPLDDAIEDCLEAMLFCADHSRGESLCVSLAEEGVADVRHMLEHRAEFLVRLGRTETAEASLIEELGRDPKDALLYVSLGDVFYTFQPVESLRDLDAADAWYYRAFDRGLARERTDAGRTLLRRLGEVCIDRLRRRAFARLASAMATFGMGPNAYVQLLTSVRVDGRQSELLGHLRALASFDENGRGLELAQSIDDAFRFMPQDGYDGLSPFEMDAYVPPGKHERRIAAEMREALGATGSRVTEKRFLDQRDPATRKVRRRLIQEERERAHTRHRDGKTVWKGFLEHREAVNVEALFGKAMQAAHARRGKVTTKRRRH